MPTVYDIAVLGATPAGYAAALTLAEKKHSVAVVDCPASRTESPLVDWIPADILKHCPPLKAAAKAGTDGVFRAVRFHSPDLSAGATFKQKTHAGYTLRRDRFMKALAALARKASIRLQRARQTVRPELEEATVVLGSQRRIRARLLMMAQGSPAEAIASLGLPVRAAPKGRMVVWGIDVPFRGRPAISELNVVAFEKLDRMGMFFAAGGRIHIRIITIGLPSSSEDDDLPVDAEAGVEALGDLIARLQRTELLPGRLDLSKAVAATWRPPGGSALEIESHLAKRTLLIGTAGGFVSAMSGQTIDPGVRSAMIAADVAHKALAGDGVQESLSVYKKLWREPLADRIRPPGTSLRMLMPMVLSNKAMTDRFAKALLNGKNL